MYYTLLGSVYNLLFLPPTMRDYEYRIETSDDSDVSDTGTYVIETDDTDTKVESVVSKQS